MIIKIDDMIKLIFSSKHDIQFLGLYSDGAHYTVDGNLYVAI